MGSASANIEFKFSLDICFHFSGETSPENFTILRKSAVCLKMKVIHHDQLKQSEKNKFWSSFWYKTQPSGFFCTSIKPEKNQTSSSIHYLHQDTRTKQSDKFIKFYQIPVLKIVLVLQMYFIFSMSLHVSKVNFT